MPDEDPQLDHRPPLTRQRVLAAAVAEADRGGVEALTMRKLAAAVGFEVMSLYHHVRNKGDLLDAMVDAVAAEVVLPDGSAGWRQDVRAIAVATHEAFVRHPWGATLWPARLPGPARKQHMEALLAAFHSSDLPPEAIDLGFHAVVNHLLGYTLQEQSYEAPADFETAARDFLAELDPQQFPHLTAHIHAHLQDAAPDAGFEFVLDLILDSLEQQVGNAAD